VLPSENESVSRGDNAINGLIVNNCLSVEYDNKQANITEYPANIQEKQN